MSERPGNKTRLRIWTVEGDAIQTRADQLATEEPLEIRLLAGGASRTLAVTMRTPGADFELAAGFLYGEGMVQQREEINRITYCVERDLAEAQRYNIVNVALSHGALPDTPTLERHFYTSSACGVCGKTSIESLRSQRCPQIPAGPRVAAEVFYRLPDRLRSDQGIFAATGGLHAAGLFDAQGRLLALREDVGRHNAVDKLIGWALLAGKLPLHQHIVMVSGRLSFELVQKCTLAGLPIVCAVSAPSSLAVALAREFGVTLVGFLRGTRFNVYTGIERVASALSA